MPTDADRYADLDTHRTRTNRRSDDGTAYDYARAHADQLADGNVVPDLDTVADRLADAGIFANLDAVALNPDPVGTVPEFIAVVQRNVNALADAHGVPRRLVTPHDRSSYPIVDPDSYPSIGVFTD